ncbi:HNH endonuclease [Pseudoroseomonas wenyumeiae]|uniref:HNH endonuclease n=1 Tax=Teichococcus wenyumeiae TaxID=2478470 RepID=A0ABX9VCB3_9PROT|nr:HNH endonuclease [Pseudoroseomonas wenyumeiae]RMI14724.1 HNH endonuclease [Pseudoroseomonas wenyumeiae]
MPELIVMTRSEVQNFLEENFTLTRPSTHARTYRSKNGTFIGVKGKNEASPLLLFPDWQERLLENPIPGITPKGIYNNHNLIDFPKPEPLRKRGQRIAAHFEVSDIYALRNLLVRIGALDASEDYSLIASSADEEIDRVSGQLAELPETERQALIQARRGQGVFRERLMAAWKNECAVTGAPILELLRASHIKPWVCSDNDERLDPENGLLLVATLDAAFDRKLISFDDAGGIVFSPRLRNGLWRWLGVTEDARLRRAPSEAQQAFLRYHRDKLLT